MGNPAWSADGTTYTYFRGKYIYGGRPKSIVDDDIVLQSDSGAVFTYNRFTKKQLELVFNFGDNDYASFLDFHQTVNGIHIPFYFSLSGSLLDSIYVRKESGFDPVESRTPGNREARYEYTLFLTEEFL